MTLAPATTLSPASVHLASFDSGLAGPTPLILTILLTIGLVFFIRASTKPRIEQMKLTSDRPETELRDQIKRYFLDRAYRLVALDRDRDEALFEGTVAASVALALFLTILAAVGFLCLGLAVSMAVPTLGYGPLVVVVLAPLAGWFYHKKSTRSEQVRLRVDTVGDRLLLIVTGHRDELAALRDNLTLEEIET